MWCEELVRLCVGMCVGIDICEWVQMWVWVWVWLWLWSTSVGVGIGMDGCRFRLGVRCWCVRACGCE